MFFRLFLLFTIVPLVELIFLIEIGRRIGVAATILIVLGTGISGAYLARSEGLRVLRGIMDDLSVGIIPADGLLHGLLILIAGALLITPGFLTDISGILLLIPFIRKIAIAYLREWFRKRIRFHM